jgi:EAL domain-containing protein (putative c-di-GMP-specific phosphodiesterase class I)
VQATINLAHSLGLTTVAEGTETPAQARALIDLGCDKAQGYLYSPAQPATTMIDTLLRTLIYK